MTNKAKHKQPETLATKENLHDQRICSQTVVAGEELDVWEGQVMKSYQLMQLTCDFSSFQELLQVNVPLGFYSVYRKA